MNRPLTRRHAEQFAALLEGSSSTTVADPALASLAAIAGSLRVAGTVTGPPGLEPQFRAALRQRLVAVASVQAADPGLAAAGPRERAAAVVGSRSRQRLAALAGTIAIATSVAGVAVAASRSLPGDPFYGVKKATESVQLWTARGDLAKGKRHLEFARTRLAEAGKLPSSSSHLASTLAAMNSQTAQGSHELIAAYQSSKSTEPLADLTRFSEQQYVGLTQLATTLPAALRRQDVASIAVLSSVVRQVQAVSHGRCILCLPTGGSTPGGSPTSSGAHPSASPTPTPRASHRSGSPTPSSHSLIPTLKASPLPTALPIHSPQIPLPTLTPNPIISTLLHPHHSSTPKPLISPLPVVSKLLGGLGL
jgi:Domain of unknown function (DUF5667)